MTQTHFQLIPTQEDLSNAYDQLQIQTITHVSCDSIAQFGQWSRFDPRLGEILVKYLAVHWKEINPSELNGAFRKQPWPSVLGPLLEFSYQLQPKENKPTYKLWKQICTSHFEKAHWEQYYIGMRRIAGKLMFEDAQFACQEYLRWGYLSREVLVNKAQGGVHRHRSLSTETRMRLLKKLSESHQRVTTHQYLEMLSFCISRRQAERDLNKATFLKAVGETQARYFKTRFK